MTILVSSANASIRGRWKKILEKEHELLEVSSVAELQRALQQQTIGLVLLHRSMVDMKLISNITETRFFVFADTPDDNEAIVLLRHGAVGYANTYISAVRLKEAVNIALAGRVWVGQKLMQKLIRGTTGTVDTNRTERTPEHNLSEREWEVALLVSKGRSNQEIGTELYVSERTVKAHLSSIFKKTHIASRLQLALYVNTLISQ